MPLKHSISILMSRFSLTYKTLLYLMIVIIFFGIIGVCALLPMIKPLTAAIDEIAITTHLYDTFFDIVKGNVENQQANYDLLVSDFNAVKNAFSSNTASVALSVVWIVIVLVMFKIAMTLCHYPISDVVNNFMAYNSRYGFSSNFIHNIGISFRYALAEFIVTLPYYLICAALICGIGYLVFLISNIIGIVIAFTLIVIMFALKKTLLSFWLPHIIYTKNGVFKCLKEQFRLLKHKFLKVFGLYVMAILLMFAFTVIFGITTLGVGFFLGYAMCVVIARIIDMVIYYRDQDHKYYIEPKNVIDAKSEIV